MLLRAAIVASVTLAVLKLMNLLAISWLVAFSPLLILIALWAAMWILLGVGLVLALIAGIIWTLIVETFIDWKWRK